MQFIPKEFHDVKLEINENDIHSLTPYYPYPDEHLLNTIAIKAPRKIVFPSKREDKIEVIPICGYYLITSRRILKYSNQDKLLVHIKEESDSDWIVSEITSRRSNEYPATPPWAEKQKEDRLKRIEEAQKYSDDELNEGQASEDVINLNILDYVKISMINGIYDIYLSKSGLESNHVKVEVIFEE